jgi:hypothetical protein
MRILLDENLPAELQGNLTVLGHECQTVRRAGFWFQEEWRSSQDSRRSVGCTRHEPPKYKISAEHDRTDCLHPDPSSFLESHERFVAAHGSLLAIEPGQVVEVGPLLPNS